MAYATVADMIVRYGEVELIRLSTPADQPMETIQHEAVERALRDGSDIADTHLRKRYRVPLDIVPAIVTRAVCILARYDLQTGEQKTISEDARDQRKDVMDWLRDIAAGKVLLDLEEVAAGDESYAQMSARREAPYGGGPTIGAGGDPWL